MRNLNDTEGLERLAEILEYPIVRVEPELGSIFVWNGSESIHTYNSDLEIVETSQYSSDKSGVEKHKEAQGIIESVVSEEKEEVVMRNQARLEDI